MTDDRCRLSVEDRGLPGRTAAVLRREEGRIPAYLARLAGGGGKGEPEAAEPPTVGALVAAIDARDPRTLGVAAFLAGRCAADGAGGHELHAVLETIVTPSRTDDLGALAEGYVEAAFSLVLRGGAAVGRAALEPIAHGAGDRTHDWLAAYLAQMGDPSGWPIIQRDLREGIDHARLMAARQLLMFLPFGDLDVEGELRRLADDPSEWVRGELLDLLAEAGFSDT